MAIIPGFYDGRDVSPKGAQRIEEIAEAGSEILLSQGLRAVNKRRIAAKLNISDGNVSYYFPTRDSLWTAVLEREFEEYKKRFYSSFLNATESPQQQFDAYVLNWIDEYQDRMVRIYFSQIVTVAETDPLIAGFRDKLYGTFFGHLVQYAKPLVRNVSESELQYRLLTIMALLEGLHVVSAFRPHTISLDDEFRRRILAHANDILRRKAPAREN
jgi:AcrR family transcriptional regulator